MRSARRLTAGHQHRATDTRYPVIVVAGPRPATQPEPPPEPEPDGIRPAWAWTLAAAATLFAVVATLFAISIVGWPAAGIGPHGTPYPHPAPAATAPR